MRGRGGRDEIWGGNAHDRLYGGSGDVSLGGGLGHDEAYGSTGGDVFWMKDGLRDVVRGGDGRDLAERDRTVDRVRSIEKFI